MDDPLDTGCLVIASVTGASLPLVVAEPSVSEEQNLERALSLMSQQAIPAAVCVNMWDLNIEITKHIEDSARQSGARVVGRTPCHRSVTLTQLKDGALVETQTRAAKHFRLVRDYLHP